MFLLYLYMSLHLYKMKYLLAFLLQIRWKFFKKHFIIFPLQELIPTSNINAVVSLTRLFETLLCSVLESEPTSKHTRIWIMVGFIFKVVLS